MKAKHKLLNDFQYISPDKKIFILKSGTILEEYNYKVKNEIIPIDRDIVDNNPEFFEVVDWKAELLSFMRVNKMPQPAQLGKKLIPFIEEMVLSSVGNAVVASDPKRERLLEEKETELYRIEKELEKKSIDAESIMEQATQKEKRADRREKETKTEQELIEKRSAKLDETAKQLMVKSEQLDEKELEIKDKENKLDLMVLESAEKTDEKYREMRQKIEDELEKIQTREKELDEREKEILSKEMSGNDSRIRSEIRNFIEFSGPTEGNINSNKTYQRDPANYMSRLFELINSIEKLV